MPKKLTTYNYLNNLDSKIETIADPSAVTGQPVTDARSLINKYSRNVSKTENAVRKKTVVERLQNMKFDSINTLEESDAKNMAVNLLATSFQKDPKEIAYDFPRYKKKYYGKVGLNFDVSSLNSYDLVKDYHKRVKGNFPIKGMPSEKDDVSATKQGSWGEVMSGSLFVSGEALADTTVGTLLSTEKLFSEGYEAFANGVSLIPGLNKFALREIDWYKDKISNPVRQKLLEHSDIFKSDMRILNKGFFPHTSNESLIETFKDSPSTAFKRAIYGTMTEAVPFAVQIGLAKTNPASAVAFMSARAYGGKMSELADADMPEWKKQVLSVSVAMTEAITESLFTMGWFEKIPLTDRVPMLSRALGTSDNVLKKALLEKTDDATETAYRVLFPKMKKRIFNVMSKTVSAGAMESVGETSSQLAENMLDLILNDEIRAQMADLSKEKRSDFVFDYMKRGLDQSAVSGFLLAGGTSGKGYIGADIQQAELANNILEGKLSPQNQFSMQEFENRLTETKDIIADIHKKTKIPVNELTDVLAGNTTLGISMNETLSNWENKIGEIKIKRFREAMPEVMPDDITEYKRVILEDEDLIGFIADKLGLEDYTVAEGQIQDWTNKQLREFLNEISPAVKYENAETVETNPEYSQKIAKFNEDITNMDDISADEVRSAESITKTIFANSRNLSNKGIVEFLNNKSDYVDISNKIIKILETDNDFETVDKLHSELSNFFFEQLDADQKNQYMQNKLNLREIVNTQAKYTLETALNTLQQADNIELSETSVNNLKSLIGNAVNLFVESDTDSKVDLDLNIDVDSSQVRNLVNGLKEYTERVNNLKDTTEIKALNKTTKSLEGFVNYVDKVTELHRKGELKGKEATDLKMYIRRVMTNKTVEVLEDFDPGAVSSLVEFVDSLASEDNSITKIEDVIENDAFNFKDEHIHKIKDLILKAYKVKADKNISDTDRNLQLNFNILPRIKNVIKKSHAQGNQMDLELAKADLNEKLTTILEITPDKQGNAQAFEVANREMFEKIFNYIQYDSNRKSRAIESREALIASKMRNNEDYQYSDEYYEDAHDLAILSIYGGLMKSKDMNQVVSAYNEINEFSKVKRKEFLKKQQKFRADNYVDELINMIMPEDRTERNKQIYDNKPVNMSIVRKIQKFIEDPATDKMPIEMILQEITRDNQTETRDKAIKHLVSMLTRHEQNIAINQHKFIENFKKAIAEIFDVNPKNASKITQYYESDKITNNGKGVYTVADMDAKVKEGEKRPRIQAEREFSRGVLLYHWMLLQRNDVVRDKLSSIGYDEQTEAEIERFLDDKDFMLAEWMFNYSSENFERIREVYKDIKGIPLPAVRNHIRMIWTRDNIEATFDDLQNMWMSRFKKSSLTSESMKVTGDKKGTGIEPLNALNVFARDTMSEEQAIGVLKPVHAFQQIFMEGAGNTMNIIKEKYGKSVKNIISNFMNDYTVGGNSKSKELRKSTRYAMSATYFLHIAGNIRSVTGQISSLPAYGIDVNIAKFGKYMMPNNMFDDKGIELMRRIVNNKTVQARWLLGHSDTVSQIFRNNNKKVRKLLRVGAMPTKVGDVIPIIFGGQAFIRAYMESNKHLGSQQQIFEEALKEFEASTNRLQQSGLLTWMGHHERQDSAVKLLWMYTKSPMSYALTTINARRELMASMKQNGLSSERTKQAYKKYAKTFFISRIFLPTAFQMVKDAVMIGFGDRPFEDGFEEYLKSRLTSIIVTGFTYPYLFLRIATEVYFAQKQYGDFVAQNFGMTPVRNIVQLGASAMEATFDEDKTYKDFFKDAKRSFSFLNQTGDIVNQIYESFTGKKLISDDKPLSEMTYEERKEQRRKQREKLINR